MSTPAENLDPTAGAAGGAVEGLPALDSDSWLTSLHIDDPVDGPVAPLPTETAAGSPEGAAPAPAQATPVPAQEAPPVVEAPKTEGDATPDPAAAAAAASPEAPVAATPEGELTPREKAFIESLPKAEQPEAVTGMGHRSFMKHYLDLDKPITEVVDHLRERSPGRFDQVESTIIARQLEDPRQFAAGLYKTNPELYGKTADAVFEGDPSYFTQKITGRTDATPEYVKTALDFYDRNKDRIADTEVEPLSLADEDTLKEMEEYFPEGTERLRKTLEAAQRASEENATLKTQVQGKEPAKADPEAAKQAELVQQQAIQKEVDEIWDMGRDTVGDYVAERAFDPTRGIGINVSDAERTAAPLVARLKDLKASVFFDGLTIGDKPVLDGYQKGLTDWGKDRNGFKEILGHMDRYTQAREKQNVLDLAKSVIPFADSYFDERLKHPVFAELDQLIDMVTKGIATPPKLDATIPGGLPAAKAGQAVAANQGANSDAYLIQDAIGRA